MSADNRCKLRPGKKHSAHLSASGSVRKSGSIKKLYAQVLVWHF